MARKVLVPDIGDFKDVPVIEIMVKVGDKVKVDDSLVILESDKATVDVPSTVAGVITALHVKVGDKVSEGAVVVEVEELAGSGSVAAPPAPAAPTIAASDPQQVTPAKKAVSVAAPAGQDLVVLGGGPGGYSAAFRAADLGMKVTLVERYPTIGGVCLNVGCIPSKALLHAAKVITEAEEFFGKHSTGYSRPKINLDSLRSWKESVVGRLTSGLSGMARARKVTVIQGVGTFLDANSLEVRGEKEKQTVKFSQAIIAVGSRVVKLPFLPDDERIVDSTGALALKKIPKRMLVLGGGIIGLEMATVYATLGAEVTVVEMGPGIMPGTDRDLMQVWEKHNKGVYKDILLKTKVVKVEALSKGLRVSFEGEGAPTPQEYDLLLVAVGRRSNGDQIAVDRAGLVLTPESYITVDSQMRTSVPHLFAIGDVVGQPMLAHKAVHQGHVAAEAASGMKSHFDAHVIPSVAYTDPEIAWVGLTEEQAKAKGTPVGKGYFPWAASGRAIANSRDEGFTKLLFDPNDHRVLGGAIVGTNAGDLIGEVALAIEMNCDATDIGKTIHPHPTLCESVGMAAEAFEGHCTDLPPIRK